MRALNWETFGCDFHRKGTACGTWRNGVYRGRHISKGDQLRQIRQHGKKRLIDTVVANGLQMRNRLFDTPCEFVRQACRASIIVHQKVDL